MLTSEDSKELTGAGVGGRGVVGGGALDHDTEGVSDLSCDSKDDGTLGLLSPTPVPMDLQQITLYETLLSKHKVCTIFENG